MAKSTIKTDYSAEEIEALIEEFGSKLETLRIRYEQYFVGAEKKPPTQLRMEVARIMRLFEKLNVTNSTNKFRIRTLTQKFTTYSTYWNRTLREIEDGTYKRHVAKAQREQERIRRAECQARPVVPETAKAEVPKHVASVAEEAEAFLAGLGLGSASSWESLSQVQLTSGSSASMPPVAQPSHAGTSSVFGTTRPVGQPLPRVPTFSPSPMPSAMPHKPGMAANAGGMPPSQLNVQGSPVPRMPEAAPAPAPRAVASSFASTVPRMPEAAPAPAPRVVASSFASTVPRMPEAAPVSPVASARTPVASAPPPVSPVASARTPITPSADAPHAYVSPRSAAPHAYVPSHQPVVPQRPAVPSHAYVPSHQPVSPRAHMPQAPLAPSQEGGNKPVGGMPKAPGRISGQVSRVTRVGEHKPPKEDA